VKKKYHICVIDCTNINAMLKFEFRDASHPKYVKAKRTDVLIKHLQIKEPCIENQILFTYSKHGRYREGEACQRTIDFNNEREIFTSEFNEFYNLNFYC
jgi:hypothetical protein